MIVFDRSFEEIAAYETPAASRRKGLIERDHLALVVAFCESN
jgi:hypothetical protein